jgi:hypothetical protein
VAYFADGTDDWRLSFVQMEYRTLVDEESGDVKAEEELTPVRYTFLVGENEPTHTPKRQVVGVDVEPRQIGVADERAQHARDLRKGRGVRDVRLGDARELGNGARDRDARVHETRQPAADHGLSPIRSAIGACPRLQAAGGHLSYLHPHACERTQLRRVRPGRGV